MEKYADSGHPYHNPIADQNQLDADPLTRTKNLEL